MWKVVGVAAILFLATVTAYIINPRSSNVAGSKKHDVYIAGFFPFDDSVTESEIGRGVLPAVRLAVDHINDNPTVLRNYILHLWWNDTKCNAAVGMKSLFDMIHEGPHKLMLFGAACTQVTDPIAKASKHWRLTQLSYADTHPMFTNDNFPNFFRIVPSENAFNPPRLKLLQEFNWTRVGTVYQNEPRYSLAHNRLVADLDILGFHVVETQSFANEVSSALSKLKEKDVRIILGNFNESWAREIFCEAYKFGMYGRKYQWLIMGTYSTNWWLDPVESMNCSLEELSEALEGCILTDLLPLSTNGEITISGNTAEEYRLEYDNLRGGDYSRFHGYTYDGIWTMALAIQHVALRIRHYRKNDTMKNFRYRDELWEQLFLQALKNTSFEGVTGPVRFYDNERKASIMLKQFQGGQEVKIGEFNGVTDSLDLSRGHVIRWLGKYPPKDRTLQIFEHNQVNLTVYILLASTASLGIIMTIVFLTINIMFRNQRYIKMSSPYLNNLIIIGCMLTYSSVIFLGLDSQLTSVEAFPYVCTARAWLLMSGFSLAFGSMFSKTWRVHSIFTDVKLNKKVIKDYQLFIVVGVLVGIDLAIMTTWQVADPFYRETKQMDPYPDPTNDDILIIPENEYCQSEKMTIFVGSIYAYKGLLMIFGAFLAWETRHVSIPALNDSKYVGMSVYNVVIMCVMGAAISFVLSDKQDASFIIISVFIIFCTTATLCLVFVPKLVELRRNPQGVIDKKTRATLRPITKSRRDSIASELEDKIKDAKLQHSKYRKQLLDTESELQVLVRRLGSDASKIADPDSSTLDRLIVPLLKKEAPSGTETTEISSLCSLNSSQDDDCYGGDPTNQTPRKKTSFAMKSLDGDKQDSALRKEQQRTRFAEEAEKSRCGQVPPGKNVSFGPPDQKPGQKPQQQQQSQAQQITLQQTQVHAPPPSCQQASVVHQPPQKFKQSTQEVKTKSEQNLEKLGITQIHPKPRQESEHRPPASYSKCQPPPVQFHSQHQQGSEPKGKPSYEDLQERKIQEVTSHLTSQLLKKHDQQYATENVRRRSSVKSANLNESLTCQLKQRRTSVPNWSSNRANTTEKKNNTKNVEKKKMLVDERSLWQHERRPSYKKHGGYIEFTGSDAEVNWSDYEGFGSEKDVYSNGSYQNYGYQESQEGLGSSGVVKYIEKDEYWVTQPDILSRRGSASQKGRTSPYLLKDNVNNLSSPSVPASVGESAQAQDVSCIHRSGSERGYRVPCHGVPQESATAAHQPSRIGSGSGSGSGLPFPSSSSGRMVGKVCAEHGGKVPKGNFNTLTHVLSTPDVAAIPPYYDSKTFDIYATEKRGKSQKSKAAAAAMGGSGHLCTAVSEGELLDLSILPIFQKLLTERHKSRTGYGASIASCPNISIKCDIVEYL